MATAEFSNFPNLPKDGGELREFQNYNLLLNNHQQENVGPHQENIPLIQGQRRSPSKMVGRAKSYLESNSIPARDAQRAQKTLCTLEPRDLTETEPELCLNVSCGSMGQQWPDTGAGALGAIGLGMASALLEEVAISPTIELPELTQDWGNRLLESTNKSLCTPGPRRKEY